MIKLDIKGFIGKRADLILRNKLQGAKLSFIFSLFRKKLVLVNSKVVKNSYRICAGDILEVKLEKDKFYSLTKMGRHFDVLYEDEYYLIVNKYAGTPVHGGQGIKWSLINEVMEYLKLKRKDFLANRLDKGTSGVVIIAKTQKSLSAIGKLIESKKVKKIYLALIKGQLPKKQGKICAKLETVKGITTVSSKGKSALTYYKLIKKFDDYSLVELELVTGRTHQIRVHLTSIGCPIVGDMKYGVFELIKRPFLHAWKLEFKHPFKRKIIRVKAEMPKDLDKVLAKL